MNTQKQILQVESLTKIYGKGDNRTEALKGIAFNVLEGEFLGIMGASGSGKTTFDWGEGYDNVTVGCTVENQVRADERLSVFKSLRIKHKNIICQPMISPINLEKYLDGAELVAVGGESDRDARPLYYDWVLSVREQCIAANVPFEFRQCGTHFIKNGKEYILPVRELGAQARKANINFYPNIR